jgi:hypothetical protein
MAKVKAKAGRFIHMDFPAEGIDYTVDQLFTLCCLNALNTIIATRLQIKVSYTGKIEPSKEVEQSKASVLRLVK